MTLVAGILDSSCVGRLPGLLSVERASRYELPCDFLKELLASVGACSPGRYPLGGVCNEKKEDVYKRERLPPLDTSLCI